MRLSVILITACIIVIAIQAASWVVTLDAAGWHDPVMVGVDPNMRLMRILYWLENGGWFAAAFPYSNAPFGEVLHWTRPLDVILVMLAAPIGLVSDWDIGLRFAGLVIGPLGLAGTILVYHRCLKDDISGPGFLMLAALVAVQPVIHNYYSFARPDHHGLLGLLFVATFFGAWRALQQPEKQSLALISGIAGGLAVWVSPEGLLGLALACIGLGLIWLYQGGQVVQVMTRMLQGALVAVCIALVLERPSVDWGAPELDRISVVYLVLIAAFAGLWTIMGRVAALHKGPLAKRFVFGSIGLVLPLSIVMTLFPKFIKGPTADVNPEVMTVWFSRINEVQPMGFGDAEAIGKAAYMLIPLLWGLAYLLWRGIKSEGPERAGMVFLGLGLIVTLGLGLYQVRWLIYAGLIGAVPLTMLLLSIWRWDGRFHGAPLRAPVFLGVITSHLLIGGAFFLSVPQSEAKAETPKKACDWAAMNDHLPSGEARRADGQRYVFFSTVHVGPALLYRYRQMVVGTPYHRNTDGILDSHRVLSAVGPLEVIQAETTLRARGVDYVVVCLNNKETKHYAKKKPRNLVGQMRDRVAPAWLNPVALPMPLDESFRLYRLQPN